MNKQLFESLLKESEATAETKAAKSWYHKLIPPAPPPWADDVYLAGRAWYKKLNKPQKLLPKVKQQDEDMQEAAVYTVNKLLRS